MRFVKRTPLLVCMYYKKVQEGRFIKYYISWYHYMGHTVTVLQFARGCGSNDLFGGRYLAVGRRLPTLLYRLRLSATVHTTISRPRIGWQQDPCPICAYILWKTCFGIRCLRPKSRLGFDWTCIGFGFKKKNISLAVMVSLCNTHNIMQ